jgi:hypothetical protein
MSKLTSKYLGFKFELSSVIHLTPRHEDMKDSGEIIPYILNVGNKCRRLALKAFALFTLEGAVDKH